MNEKEEINETNRELTDYTFPLEEANHFIDSADQKTGISLTLISITFTLYAGFLLENRFFTSDIDSTIKTWLIVLTSLSFVSFSLSIFFYCFVLFPRFKKHETKDNPYYYYEVAQYKEVKDFVDRFIDEKDERLFVKGQLESLYENSRIVLKKMRRFRIGLIFTALFFAFSIACIVITLFTAVPSECDCLLGSSILSEESSRFLSNISLISF